MGVSMLIFGSMLSLLLCLDLVHGNGITGKENKIIEETVNTLLRKPRQALPPRRNLTVEMYLVVDFAAYSLWKDFISAASRILEKNVLPAVRNMYTLHAEGVSARFKRIASKKFSVNVSLAGIYIATSSDGQPWIHYKHHVSGNVSLDVMDVMHSLEQFVIWTNMHGYQHADHYIWITGYNLEGSKSFGFDESMCTNMSASIVQDDLDFILQTRIAHRIGRSLGLKLDEVENECYDLGFVMSQNVVAGDNNLWNFSTCSIMELEDIVEWSNSTCLLNRTFGSPLTVPWNYTLPGVYISVDKQCNTMVGPSFYLCRTKYAMRFDDVCSGILCCNSSGSEHRIVPMEGIACDTYKYCINGQCIGAPYGQGTYNPGSCLFGDFPFLLDGGQSCHFSVGRDSSMCYDRDFKATCCDSCDDARTHQTGCEFGDRVDCDDVIGRDCYDPDIRHDCCDTCSSYNTEIKGCEFGDRGQGCDNITARDCYDTNIRDQCCETCNDFDTGISGCPFGNKVASCDVNVPSDCYNTDTQNDCCQSCSEFEIAITGCKYGDREADCKRQYCYTYSPQKKKHGCCQTCAVSGSTSPTPAVTTTPTVSVTANTEISTTVTASDTVGTWSTLPSSSPTSSASGAKNVIVPVAAGVGGVVVVLIIVVGICCWKRRRFAGPKHLSPISDVMYNEYKLSKRAPIPEPRDFSKPKSSSKQKLVRQDSEVYAYIDPGDVATIPSKTETESNHLNANRQGRNEDDPLPPTPGDYLELKVVDKYGYMEPVEKHTSKPNPYSEPYSDNVSPPYANKGVTSARDGSQGFNQKL